MLLHIYIYIDCVFRLHSGVFDQNFSKKSNSQRFVRGWLVGEWSQLELTDTFQGLHGLQCLQYLQGLRSWQELVGLQEIQGQSRKKFSGSLRPIGVTGLLCEKNSRLCNKLARHESITILTDLRAFACLFWPNTPWQPCSCWVSSLSWVIYSYRFVIEEYFVAYISPQFISHEFYKRLRTGKIYFEQEQWSYTTQSLLGQKFWRRVIKINIKNRFTPSFIILSVLSKKTKFILGVRCTLKAFQGYQKMTSLLTQSAPEASEQGSSSEIKTFILTTMDSDINHNASLRSTWDNERLFYVYR